METVVRRKMRILIKGYIVSKYSRDDKTDKSCKIYNSWLRMVH